MTRRRRYPPTLSPHAAPSVLPAAESALDDPPGLVALGGSLSPDWLRHAYRHGIFPWFGEGDPILWWSPPTRMVLRPDQLRITRSLKKSVRNRGYTIGFDEDFSSVIRGCAMRGADIQATDPCEHQAPDTKISPAPDTTWILPAMVEAYTLLHLQGDAHSVEVRLEGELVGGLYGVQLGSVFWGESMFHRSRDASKVALLGLAAECRRRGIELIDAQFRTDHLASLGGCEMPRSELLAAVRRLTRDATPGITWRRSPEPACKVVQDSPAERHQD